MLPMSALQKDNDLQNSGHKTKDWVTQAPLNNLCDIRCIEVAFSSVLLVAPVKFSRKMLKKLIIGFTPLINQTLTGHSTNISIMESISNSICLNQISKAENIIWISWIT
jgi:hypothetical protein